MSLINLCGRQFSSGLKRRGEEFLAGGRLRRMSGESARTLRYVVRDDVEYGLSLELGPVGHGCVNLVVSCGCPYFGDYGPCEHIWAAIVDAQGSALESYAHTFHTVRVIDRDEWVPLANDTILLDNDTGIDADVLGHVLDGDFRERFRETMGLYDEFDDEFDDEYDDGCYDDEYDDDDDESWGEEELSFIGVRRLPGASPTPEDSLKAWRLGVVGLSAESGAQMEKLLDEELLSRPAKCFHFELVLCEQNSIFVPSIALRVYFRQRLKSGNYGEYRQVALDAKKMESYRDWEIEDSLRRLLVAEMEDSDDSSYDSWEYSYGERIDECRLKPKVAKAILPQLCKKGRVFTADDKNGLKRSVHWEDGEPFQFFPRLRKEGNNDLFCLGGALHRGEMQIPLSAAQLIIGSELVVVDNTIYPLLVNGCGSALERICDTGELKVPLSDLDECMAALYQNYTGSEPIELEGGQPWSVVMGQPTPLVRLGAPPAPGEEITAALGFCYGEEIAFKGLGVCRYLVDEEKRETTARNVAEETRYRERLLEVEGVSVVEAKLGIVLAGFSWKTLAVLVEQLCKEGWEFEFEKQRVRIAGSSSVQVRTGVDWFEVDASVEFGREHLRVPDLLKRGREYGLFVRLADGSFGLLPAEWLKKYELLAGISSLTEEGVLRCERKQLPLLDILLAELPEVEVDGQIAALRANLDSLRVERSSEAAESFHGELRHYQQRGLGWLEQLEGAGFGGCLADDMGLGKTVQVLAHLHRRKVGGHKKGVALLVAPKTLVENWLAEGGRFVPELKMEAYVGRGRSEVLERLSALDVLITSYDYLRRDILVLKDIEFDYVVLDEAQAIKNGRAKVSKAARLLKASHRVALSGTPVENHLSELFAIFDFLNPGMLGGRLRQLACISAADLAQSEYLQFIQRAFRPFILRRTKEEVLPELPPKSEKCVFCELSSGQRRKYEELRTHYQALLATKVKEEGLAKSQMNVLEALLRLRQAACSPALIDKRPHGHESAKIEWLLEKLREIVECGHKALVFSQFTTLLGLVRKELDAAEIPYLYLDGKTKERAQLVENFQNGGPPVFLLSLKAGGLGLNLTAADYCFLLDPWWNPAVERQAIDRAHRIGQSRTVMAYRLIAKDTVEEKIQQLQSSKRELAEAIVNSDKGPLRSMTVEDLEFLLQ